MYSLEILQIYRSHGVTIDDYFIHPIKFLEETGMTQDNTLLVLEQSVDCGGYGTHNLRHIKEGGLVLAF